MLFRVALASCCSGRVLSQYLTSSRCTSQRGGCIACMSLWWPFFALTGSMHIASGLEQDRSSSAERFGRSHWGKVLLATCAGKTRLCWAIRVSLPIYKNDEKQTYPPIEAGPKHCWDCVARSSGPSPCPPDQEKSLTEVNISSAMLSNLSPPLSLRGSSPDASAWTPHLPTGPSQQEDEHVVMWTQYQGTPPRVRCRRQCLPATSVATALLPSSQHLCTRPPAPEPAARGWCWKTP